MPELTMLPIAERPPGELPAADTPLHALDEASRVRLGAAPDSPPALLAALAHDPSVTVRASLALNNAASGEIDAVLQRDADVRVRALLATRVASLLPGLAAPDQAAMRQRALAMLTLLVADTAMQVRAAIAEVLKDMPQAPRELVLRLAQDCAIPVSEPVLRLSPLLGASDLLGLLASNPHSATATAIARRPDLCDAVADAIAHGSDTDAITALLSNPTVAMREATLDALIARAGAQVAWHQPLVRQPRLSAAAAAALAGFVADELVQILASRADLPPALGEELRARLAGRLGVATALAGPDSHPMHALRLHAEGMLTEAALRDAIASGNVAAVQAMLAVAAGVPQTVVQRAVNLGSMRALVSLVWKAGFSMAIAVPVQQILGTGVGTELLRATPAGGFALSAAEMQAQLDTLRSRF